MCSICRTCLRKITDKNFLALTESAESLRVKTELSVCIPEMVVDMVTNPVMCLLCVDALHSAYEFKKQCLQTEERICKYRRNMDLNEEDCVSSAQMHNRFDVSHLLSCTVGLDNLSELQLEPINTGDIADELNSLLDDALQNASNYSAIVGNGSNSRIKEKQSLTTIETISLVDEESEDNFEDDCAVKLYNKSSEINDDQHVVVQNKIDAKESSGKCVKLRNNLDESKINLKNLEEIWTQNIHQFNGNSRSNKGSKCSKQRECNTSTKYNLRKHKKNHSAKKFKNPANSSTPLKSDVSEERFACKFCSFKAKTQLWLNHHLKSHSAANIRVCKICSYRTAVKGHFNAHMNAHSGEKPYACEICKYRTAYRCNLKTHLKRHGNGEPFRSIKLR